MITIKNVNKQFNTKRGTITALHQINLDIRAGEIFGVIGYSGAGKSTLLRLLNGLELPNTGIIHVADQEISSAKEASLRKVRQEIGMIFQHFNLLWSRTVRDNIAFPLEIAGVKKAERQERVDELIKLVGLEGRADAYPAELSGGQKQRVGIARALANRPKVLLCDEATSALDPETTDAILNLLVDINKRLGITIVLITHEMQVIRKICHRVAVMENGEIVELGDVLQVFKHPQQTITKTFVQQMTETDDTKETASHLLEKYPNGKIVKLTFIGDMTAQPLMTDFIRSHSLTINILHGSINQTQEGAYGTLFLHIEGTEDEMEAALQYLQTRQIGVEVLTAHD